MDALPAINADDIDDYLKKFALFTEEQPRMSHLRQRTDLLLDKNPSNNNAGGFVLASVLTRKTITNTVTTTVVQAEDGGLDEVVLTRRFIRTVREVYPEGSPTLGTEQIQPPNITAQQEAKDDKESQTQNLSETLSQKRETAAQRSTSPTKQTIEEAAPDIKLMCERNQNASSVEGDDEDCFSKLSPLSPAPKEVTANKQVPNPIPLRPPPAPPIREAGILCARCLSHGRKQPNISSSVSSHTYPHVVCVRSRSPSVESSKDSLLRSASQLPRAVAAATVASIAKCSEKGLSHVMNSERLEPVSLATMENPKPQLKRGRSPPIGAETAVVVFGASTQSTDPEVSRISSSFVDPHTWLSYGTSETIKRETSTRSNSHRSSRRSSSVAVTQPTEMERKRSALAAKKLKEDRERLKNSTDAFIFVQEWSDAAPPREITKTDNTTGNTSVRRDVRADSRENNSRAPSPRPSFSIPSPQPSPNNDNPFVSTAFFRNHVTISPPTARDIERSKAAAKNARKDA